MKVGVTCAGTGSSGIWCGGGGVWVVVRMMFVDYTLLQMMCYPAHITMNASLSHYLYIMATTPRRGQASSWLINPLTSQPKEKWEAKQHCSLLIHRLYLTPKPWIACRTHYMTFVISLYIWRYRLIMGFCTFHLSRQVNFINDKNRKNYSAAKKGVYFSQTEP